MVATNTRFRATEIVSPMGLLPGTNLYTAGHGSTVTQDAPARQHIGTAMDGVSPNPYLPSHPTTTSGHDPPVTQKADAAQPENQP